MDASLRRPRGTPRSRKTWSSLLFECPPRLTPEPPAGAEATETVQPGERFGFVCALGKQEPSFQPWGIPQKNLDFRDFEGRGKGASSGEQRRVEDELADWQPSSRVRGGWEPGLPQTPPDRSSRPGQGPASCPEAVPVPFPNRMVGFCTPTCSPAAAPTNSLLSSSTAPPPSLFLSTLASCLSPPLRPFFQRPRRHEADPCHVFARSHLIISLLDHPIYNPSAPPRTPHARPRSVCSAAPGHGQRTRMSLGLGFPRQNIQNVRTGRAGRLSAVRIAGSPVSKACARCSVNTRSMGARSDGCEEPRVIQFVSSTPRHRICS